ncbi:membrane-bound lytic murein transglycosylase B [Aeromicrobium sp. SORGH_AS981]|uniref:lytic transglycosylase domain-containing protein n=2 Tax=unclassified Aeromicrobium TaxID=2633570 RepID=UPI00285BCB56|nr:lytic murein transglycosylase [Aeromicrobium sp. SORGH_AS_0981]MDR6120257.1 membrane-bound lytic murein transglycosylase B [Aeromicrobium sp. SORGH_AS_0981]
MRERLPVLCAGLAGLLGVVLLVVAVVLPDTESDAVKGAASAPPEARASTSSAPQAASRGAQPDPAQVPVAQLPDGAWIEATAASTGVEARVLRAYAGAALRLEREQPGCRLGWNTLAAIGAVESEHGTIDGSVVTDDGVADPPIIGVALDGGDVRALKDTDDGEVDGDDRWDRAVGPMQFLPSTWERWGADGDGDGRADPQHVDDAALAAARYLCHGERDLTRGPDWVAAISSYNEGSEYHARVLEQARSLASLAAR